MATQKTETLRGEERIQQLMEEYPEIHRTLVLKTELIREGLRPSAGSLQVGRWSLPETHSHFQYSKEDTHKAETAREGYILSPFGGHFANGVTHWFMWDTRSPYEIRYEERGRYRLYRDDQPVEELFFTPRPQWYDGKTSSGRPMPSVIQQRGEGSLMLVPLAYCEYGKDNRQCRYCNINASEATKKGLGMVTITAKREEDVYETFVAAAQESRIRSIGMSGGVILDSSKEADVYERLIKTVKRAMKEVGYEVPVSANPQAMATEDQIRLKEAGLSSFKHNLEVWDTKLWEIICPGKAKYVGREKWIEAILSAKKVFGSTQTSFVSGVEMAPPYGFKTEDEAAASVLEGFEWMMAHGVMPGGAFWRPAPGTEFAGLPAPRTEYFLRLAQAHHKLAQEYNMAPKPGKPTLIGPNIYGDVPHVPVQKAAAVGKSPAAGPSGDAC